MIKFFKAHETVLNKTIYQLHSILPYQKQLFSSHLFSKIVNLQTVLFLSQRYGKLQIPWLVWRHVIIIDFS